MHLFLLLLLLVLQGCATSFERPVKKEPLGPHDLEADRAACREMAETYGVINIGPMMGDSAQNVPDRTRRNRLFILCMEEKGYRF